MRILVNLLAAVTLLGAATLAQALQPIRNVVDAPIASASGKPLTDDQIKAAIVRAGVALGWKMQAVKPGLIVGTLDIRKHQAIVEIPYTAGTYSITYKSSINLDEKDGQIHRNYNGWIQNLTNGINAQLSAAAL